MANSHSDVVATTQLVNLYGLGREAGAARVGVLGHSPGPKG